MTSSPLKFNKDCKGFYATLRERADQYFLNNKRSRHADRLMVGKTVLFVGGTFSLYLLLLFGGFAPLTMLFMALVMGMFSAFIGFNVCHDALHGSYSQSSFVNTALGSIFHLLGANTYNWKISHNVVHHTYTNIHDHDDDLVVAPGLVSVCPQDRPNAIQRYQHFYAFLLYGFASLSWIFVKDYQKFFQDNIGQSYDTRKHPRVEYYKLFFFKALYYVLVIVLPLLLIEQITWWQFATGFVAMQMAKGFVLGLVFQLAHIVEDLEFPAAHTSGCMEDAWAIHQLRTTANFGRKSFLTTFFCGGLNMQVEHHLFPKVCHTHYTALSNIVKQTAEEFGVPYYENESFGTALASHYRLLRRFGRDALRERKLKLEPVVAK